MSLATSFSLLMICGMGMYLGLMVLIWITRFEVGDLKERIKRLEETKK